MITKSLVETYKELKNEPTPAKQLILDVIKLTGRKESAIRKWLDGSARPDESTCLTIEQGMRMTFDAVIKEYYDRLNLPTSATKFRRRIEVVTHRSKITVMRYVQGVIIPDALTQSVIAKELNTTVSTLFP
jgi:transcriptional regulator with XRE-family HTH domain